MSVDARLTHQSCRMLEALEARKSVKNFPYLSPEIVSIEERSTFCNAVLASKATVVQQSRKGRGISIVTAIFDTFCFLRKDLPLFFCRSYVL